MRKVLHLMGVLTDRDIEWLTSQGTTKSVSEGTTVIRQGEPVPALFVLLEGRLSVRVGAGGGREVAVLYPGEVLGEISFVDSRPPSATIVSVTDAQLFLIDRETLNAALTHDVAFAARFYRAVALFLADRLRTTTANLGYGKEAEPPADVDEIDDAALADISQGARRFDEMLRRLRINA